MFSQTITDFWQETFLGGEILFRNDKLTLSANPGLSEDRRAMLLQTADGRLMATLTPALADRLGLYGQRDLSEPALRQRLGDGGVALHGADHVFYFTETEQRALPRQGGAGEPRLLTERDQAIFAEFQASASEQDLDDAYVELDHWAVFGALDGERLVSAASMYRWGDAAIADMGVLTLPPFRGRGHAARVVRALSGHACEQGHEPQYRCQFDNLASAALARAAGLTWFGKWEVISPDSAE
ncbi:GNAT family N-acetyltransferase [Chromobacterium sp. CV08]|uniref:GNAT family N-acetyltransferase n=1 Tax=Chromobacterium sp. CV08 TaxID=3133274 RepID=UPI003DA89C2D